MRARIALTASVSTLALALAPGWAGAATTIGQTFVPAQVCAADTTRLATTSPGTLYEAPADGVITSWSFQAAATAPQVQFKVGRRAGGNAFTRIAESLGAFPVAGTLNTFPVQIPVLAGDLIGLYTRTAGHCGTPGVPGYAIHSLFDDPPLGTTSTFTGPTAGQLDVSATLETTTCAGMAPTVAGTAGDDTLVGTPDDDVIVGLGGKDKLRGFFGNDLICGGDGKDTIKGQSGRDKLLGQGGRDKLDGGPGQDRCQGGKGEDSGTDCERGADSR